MHVLVVWPPHIPSYFNAGHHLPIFTIASYLRSKGMHVDAIDAGALNNTWKEFGDRIYQGQYDAIIIVNEYDVVEGVRRAVDYCKAISPSSKLATVGRLSYENPGFFRYLPLDGIVTSGDYESGVFAFLDSYLDASSASPIPGVSVRADGGWLDESGPGEWMNSSSWCLPDVQEIPYAAYENLYRDDGNKFCGIPNKRELVVPVARGCSIGCSFCDVPGMQGLKERRLSVARTIEYIERSFEKVDFEYVAFYAPTFTLDKKWVRELCDTMQESGLKVPWKCATTVHHLDDELIARMADSGCIRISVGVETFEDAAADELPRVKQLLKSKFGRVVDACTYHGVELNCFVIVGLPGTTPDGTRRTMEQISAANGRARPTLYTPYELMHENMSEREVSAFNRQIFVESPHAGAYAPSEYLSFIFGADDYKTTAPNKIVEYRAFTKARG